jgi:hypothetical protein
LIDKIEAVGTTLVANGVPSACVLLYSSRRRPIVAAHGDNRLAEASSAAIIHFQGCSGARVFPWCGLEQGKKKEVALKSVGDRNNPKKQYLTPLAHVCV